MFWTNIYTLSPHIEALLNKEDVTLYELLDQEEIVAECKSQNKKLVEFLTRPEIIEELVMLTIKEPSEDIDERSRFKYPNIACELLTCNVTSLNEKLAGSEALLTKLYSFIDTDEELNPLLASFFSKIIGALLIRKSDQNWYSYQFVCLQVLEFLKNRDKCVDRLLQHLNTSAIMDLILKLITKIEGADMIQNVKKWLDDKIIIQQLVKLLTPTNVNERHTNSSQLLSNIIKLSRDNRLSIVDRIEPDPILDTLESEEIIVLLLDTILAEPQTESSIVGGIEVLLVLLGQESTSQQTTCEIQGNNNGDDNNDGIDRLKIQNATLPYLEKLHKLLINPPVKPAVKTTAGILDCPLGNTRLHVARLFTALLSNENFNVYKKLQEFGTFEILLDLFFKYSWNNFLHMQVEQCLALLISENWEGDEEKMIHTHIFIECKLIERILEAWEDNDNKQKLHKGVRQGYMGHLICIANNIVKQTEKSEKLDKFLKDNIDKICYDKWNDLVNNQLAEINKTNEILLGGKLQAYVTSSEDSSEDFNSYPQDTYAQQIYANYQEQQMTSQVIEQYGFHDDEFNEGNDALQPSNSVDQLNTMPFSMNEEDLIKQEDMFNKICQQKQKSGLDEGGIEWGDEGDLTFQTVIDKRDWPFKQQQNDSMSSDEDEETKNLHMEIDTTDPWNNDDLSKNNNNNNNNLLSNISPWDIETSTSDNDNADWANFDNFENTLPNLDNKNDNDDDNDDNDDDDVNNTKHVNIDLNKDNKNVNDNKLSFDDDDDTTLTIKYTSDGNNEILNNDNIVTEKTKIHDDGDDDKQKNIDTVTVNQIVDDKIIVADTVEHKNDNKVVESDKSDVKTDALSTSNELEVKSSDNSNN